MRKKYLILLLTLFAFGLFGCTKEEPQIKDPIEDSFKSVSDDFTYYKSMKFNQNKILYVYGNDVTYSFGDVIIGQAIQGLFARESAMFYYLENNSEMYLAWLNDLVDNYGVIIEDISLEHMINMYKNEFIDYGYILYNKDNLQSVNVACSLAGVLNYLPVDISSKQKVDALGIPLKLDVSLKSEKWCFDNYQFLFDNSGLVQLRGDIKHLRDYGIASKYFFFYPDSLSTSTVKFRGEVHQWAKKDAPIFGWGPFSEDSHVGISSQNGHFTIPSDYCYNMTIFTCLDLFNLLNIKQPNKSKGVVAEDNKHYVSFVRSDGDNVQTWYNFFPFNKKDMLAPRNDFPMGWSIQPSLIDLGPNILNYVYQRADKNDYFVCAVSGHGYIYPQTYANLKSFTESLSMYLRKTDLDIVQILDSGVSPDIVEAYSLIPELKGGMYMFGDRYAGGKGSIYWSKNNKPFVTVRESLWDEITVDLAKRINSYKRDYTSIEGYTLINLHPWSMSYQDVAHLVSLLDPNVIVVSPDDFFDLIIKHVPRKNVILN